MNKKKKPEKKGVVLKPEVTGVPFIEKKNLFVLIGIVVLTIMAYLPVFSNDFVDWDDYSYIQNNPLIYSLHLKEYFTQFYSGNYHPLTLLVFRIEYLFFGMNATGFHTVNLILHLSNVVLVFLALFLLTEKAEIGLIVSLLFGIHPLHVESVAWASELKDLLYTFFFLLSLIYYLNYVRTNSGKQYAFGIIFFFLSLLSKGMAASFPIVLLLTDYFMGRKIDRKVIMEKIPFLLLALIFGFVAVVAQKSIGAIAGYETFAFPQRIVFACFGFITYLVKLVLPLQLSVYYPYPVAANQSIPFQYYLYIPLVIGLVWLSIRSIRISKNIFFGLGFFSITVFLVLQLLPVGNAVMADRYSYIPSIGIFYLAAEGFLWLRKKNYKIPAMILLALFTIFFSIQTFARCKVWKNGITLWDDVIAKYKSVPAAYNNQGFIFFKEKKYDKALNYYNKAIELSPNFYTAINNRGVLYAETRKMTEALADYNKVVELQPDFYEVYNYRGLLFANLKKYEDALNDYNRALELNPDFAIAYNNRGTIFMNEQKFQDAVADYDNAIRLQPDYARAYLNRGVALAATKNPEAALNDFNKSINLQPDNPQTYFNRGLLFVKTKNYQAAISDFDKVLSYDSNNAMAYYQRGISEYFLDRKNNACGDFQKAAQLGLQTAEATFYKFCR